MDVARDGPADAKQLLRRQQRLPRRRGLLRLGRAGRAAARRPAWRAGRTSRRRRGAVRPRAQSLRLLLVAAHHARERRPEPQLPRLQRRRCRSTRPTTRSPPLIVPPRPGRRPRRTTPRSAGSSPRTASAPCKQALSGGQYDYPDGLFFGGAAADLEPPDAAPGAAPARPRAASGWPGSTCTPGLGPERPRRAHLRLPRRRRRLRARQGLVGRRHVDLRRLVDLGAPHRPDVQRRLRGMPAGRVHRHRARVRHAAAGRGDAGAARRPVAREPPRGRRRDPARDQAAGARRLLHRHRCLEAADRRPGHRCRVRRRARPERDPA